MKNKKTRRATADKTKQKTVTLRLPNQQNTSPYPLSQALGGLQQLLVSGRDIEAISILEQLCKQLRREKTLTIELLRLYVGHKQLDKAGVLSRAMLKKFPGDSDVLTRVAQYSHTMGEAGRAIELLETAMRLDPGNLVGQHVLGTTYLGVGERGKALACFDKILNRDPGNAFAIFAKATAEKSNASSEFRENVLRLVNDGQREQQDLILLHFAAAGLFESIDTAVHFDHLHQANALAGNGRPWHEENEKRRHDKNVTQFRKPQIDTLMQQGDTDMRPIFIAAMPRSGTTLLEQMLGAHSETCCVGENAPFDNAINQAFSKHNAVAQCLRQEKGLPLEYIKDYEEAIQGIANEYRAGSVIARAGGRRIVDKSIVNHQVVGAILLVFPNARIIHLQRHPLDIIYSCYQQYFETGHNFIFDLRSAARYYKIYDSIMAHWKSVFPDNIYTLRYEDLVVNPEATLGPLLDFCDLPWEDSCLNYRETMGSVNTASAGQVIKPLYTDSMAKWERVKDYLQPAVDELGEHVAY